MKKIFLVALAAIGMTACMQDEVVEIANGGAIAFDNAFVGNATRADAVTTGSLEAFKVWGYVNEPSGVVFNGTVVSDPDKDGVWGYDRIQYWMPENDYSFAAIAPVSAVADDWDLNASRTIEFTTDGTVDLVYAAKEVVAAPTYEKVAFQFEHLLSKVKLSFTQDLPEYNVAYIKDLVVETVKTATVDLTEKVWTPGTETLSLVNADLTTYETEDYFIVPAECKVSFKVVVEISGVEVYNKRKTATIPADAFVMGHAYNLCAEINPATLALDEIEFSADVTDWVEVTDPDNTYNPAANLLYAAQVGGTYTLTEDVALETPVVVPAGVDFVLNLNGKSITSPVDAFEVAGGSLTINGDGLVYAASGNEVPYCAVWAYGDGYVRINGGEYKIGYPVGDYNDLIYAKENAKIDIYGGYFHNSGKENAFVLNIKDNSNADITVYGGTFVNFNPANNNSEGPNTSFVAPGYKSTEENGVYTVKYDAVETVAEFKSKVANGETNIMLAGNAVIDITDEVVYLTNATNISAPADSKATLKGKFVAESGQITFANIKFAPNAQFSTTLPGTYGTYVNGNYAAIVTVHKTAANFENCEFDGGDEYAVSITYFDEEPGIVMNVNNCKFTQTYIYSKVLCNLTNNTFILNDCPYAMCVWPNTEGTTNGKCHFVNNTVSSNFYSADGKGHSLVQLLTQSTPYANTEFNVQGNTTDATKYIYGWVAAVTCATDGTVTFAEGSSRFDINQTSGKPE